MAWNKTLPATSEKLKDTPAILQANFAAIELGTDAALQITNAKVAADAGIVDTKLAEISTANKVNATAFKNLAGTPSGAGQIPVANIPDLAATKITSGTMSADRLPVGTTANKIVQLDSNAKIPAVDGSQLTNVKPADLAIASQARGDLLYFDGTNWKRLAKGDAGQVLKIGANDPIWGDLPKLGIRSDKSSDYGAQKAATDGMVEVVASWGDNGVCDYMVEGFTDGATNPTIRKGLVHIPVIPNNGAVRGGSFCMFVKKNEYWKIVRTVSGSVTGESLTVTWLPLS